jgi:hypothetical protein
MKHAHRVLLIPELAGHGRLGRHIEHDTRSRAFEIAPVRNLQSVSWKRLCDPFDQGSIGSCTGNAMAGACMTEPLHKPGVTLDEEKALELYELATRLDRVPGSYPPDDTGSSGLAVARAAKRQGLISRYSHAFSLHGLLSGLQHGPVIVGTNWYESFDVPRGPSNELVIGGQVRGGHEYEILAFDMDRSVVRMCNSWGTGWGDHGYATMSLTTLEQLLAEHGDCVIPHP